MTRWTMDRETFVFNCLINEVFSLVADDDCKPRGTLFIRNIEKLISPG